MLLHLFSAEEKKCSVDRSDISSKWTDLVTGRCEQRRAKIARGSMLCDLPSCELQSQALYFSAVIGNGLLQWSGLQLTVGVPCWCYSLDTAHCCSHHLTLNLLQRIQLDTTFLVTCLPFIIQHFFFSFYYMSLRVVVQSADVIMTEFHLQLTWSWV